MFFLYQEKLAGQDDTCSMYILQAGYYTIAYPPLRVQNNVDLKVQTRDIPTYMSLSLTSDAGGGCGDSEPRINHLAAIGTVQITNIT